jgi:hypothetical protein
MRLEWLGKLKKMDVLIGISTHNTCIITNDILQTIYWPFCTWTFGSLMARKHSKTCGKMEVKIDTACWVNGRNLWSKKLSSEREECRKYDRRCADQCSVPSCFFVCVDPRFCMALPLVLIKTVHSTVCSPRQLRDKAKMPVTQWRRSPRVSNSVLRDLKMCFIV